MGVAYQGIYGNFVNKVGNVVGRIRRGEQTYSIYQRSVTQPDTNSQMSQRALFTLITQFVATMGSWFEIFGESISKVGQTAYNAIFSLIFREKPFSGTYPNQTLNYTKVKIASGALDLPYDLVANVDGADIVVNWTDNSDLGNGKPEDDMCFFVYNEVKKAGLCVMSGAKRVDAATTLTIPSSWNTDALHVWTACKRDDDSVVSDSFYLGSFTI